MRHSSSCRNATARAKQIVRQGLGVVACAAIAGVMTIGTAGGAWAKGGYGGPKPPTAFAPQELLLIEKCRAVARTEGTDSAPFLRQCSTVRRHINY
jgi:hypothetical protein